jgi:hypothetical protein
VFKKLRGLGTLAILLRGINNRLKRIEKKVSEHYRKNGNVSAKLDKLSKKLDEMDKKSSGFIGVDWAKKKGGK